MNKQTEALKMAIEAMEHANERSILFDAYDEVIQACKEALEQPSWQGLSDDEILAFGWMDEMSCKEQIQLARAIEQALKEKNS